MIDRTNNPVAWAMLMYELEETRDHLTELLDEMSKHGKVDESRFRIAFAHVYTHLNRMYHGRSDPHLDQVPESEQSARDRFPDDFEPTG